MAWVLNDAPGLPANAFGTLMGLANHADHEGRGARAAQATLGKYARKTDRQIRRDLTELEELGLIRRGDQRLVAHLPPMKRPIVWDLAMELRETVDSDRTPTTGHGSPAGHARPVTDVQPDTYDRSYTAARPDVHVRQTVLEPTTQEKTSSSPLAAPRKRAARTAKPDAPLDPETHQRATLAKQIIQWWWEQLPIKPAGGTRAFFASCNAVEKLLAVGHDPKSIANAARAVGSPITVPRLEQELNRVLRATAPTAAKPATSDLRAAQGQEALARLKQRIANGQDPLLGALNGTPASQQPVALPGAFREIEP
jgi:hypothetical protein